jgi:hypothetical protein
MACNLIFNEILLTGFSLPGNRHNRQIDRAAADATVRGCDRDEKCQGL